VQEETGESVELAFVDQGDTGGQAAEAAEEREIELAVVKLPEAKLPEAKLPEAKRGFVLLPRRWVVERSFAWLARFRRLAKDYERLASTLKGTHLAAFAIIMLARLVNWSESA
jgi:transposase